MFVSAKNIFCPKVDRVGTNFSAPAFGSRNIPISVKIPVVHPPPELPNGRFGGGGVHAAPAAATKRARTSRRIVPDARRCSNSSHPGRFGAPFRRNRVQVPSLPRPPDVHQRARLAQTYGPMASRSWVFWIFWLQSRPQGGVLACADGAIQMLQYPGNKKFLTYFSARTTR